MAGEFTTVRIEDIALEMGDAPFGSHLKTSDYTDEGALVVQGKNVQGRVFDWSDKRHVSKEKWNSIPRSHCFPGDLIFPKVGTIGKVGILSECPGHREYLLSTNTMRLRVDPQKADPLYIYYYFTWSKTVNLIHALNSKSVQPVFNYTTLKQFALELPPVDEQRAIAHILGTLDDKIELNRRMNETLEAMARAIFKSWFVDFDPVRAKASGEPPESICRRLGLTPDLLALFPDRLVDSELGEIPEGWEWSSIGDQVDIVGGGTPSTKESDYWDGGSFNWATPKDLSGNPDSVLLKTGRKITQKGLEVISSGLLPAGTVLLSSRAPVGYLTIAKMPTAINQGFIAMKCHKLLTPEYVLQWANSAMDEIKQRASGTTFAEISKKNFRPIKAVVPTSDVMDEYTSVVRAMYDKISLNVAESDSVGEIRDSLLPKLLSGELLVTEATNE